MDKSEFAKQQFITLREEIKEGKARIFKIQSLGIIVVPASAFLGKAYNIDILILTTPLLVMVVALMFLFETTALMRCGIYIKENIEPIVNNIEGWEEWLQLPGSIDKRKAELYMYVSFLLLFIVYFLASVFLAFTFSIGNYNLSISYLVLSIYASLGVWFVIFLIKNSLLTT